MKYLKFGCIALAALVSAMLISQMGVAHDLSLALASLGHVDAHSMASLAGLSAVGFIGEVRNLNLPRLDAEESAFFSRELEYVKTRSYDKKYADIKARMIIPVSTEADPWADSIVYESYDHVGMAKLITGYSSDLPRADVKAQEFIHPVKSLGSSYGYNIMEIRKSAARGKSLEQRKANAAKRAILEKENALALLGDSDVGFDGFLKHPNVPVVVLPADNTSNDTEWINANGVALKTPSQILRDLHMLVNAVVDQSLGKETPDTLLLPRSRFLYVASTPFSTGDSDGKTILKMFLEQSLYIKNVEWLNELETAGSGGSKRMMAYRRDPEAVTMEIPQDFEQFDPQPENLEFVVPCHSRFGGVLFYYPLSAAYADEI